nr:MAG TPA: hypothetical protein [Caudoviricetes sp.]
MTPTSSAQHAMAKCSVRLTTCHQYKGQSAIHSDRVAC